VAEVTAEHARRVVLIPWQMSAPVGHAALKQLTMDSTQPDKVATLR
jgi:hypothetical protein